MRAETDETDETDERAVDLCWPLLTLLTSVDLRWLVLTPSRFGDAILLTSVDFCWLLLTCVHSSCLETQFFGLPLTSVDLCWAPLTSVVDFYWPPLTSVDFCWPALTPDEGLYSPPLTFVDLRCKSGPLGILFSHFSFCNLQFFQILMRRF